MNVIKYGSNIKFDKQRTFITGKKKFVKKYENYNRLIGIEIKSYKIKDEKFDLTNTSFFQDDSSEFSIVEDSKGNGVFYDELVISNSECSIPHSFFISVKYEENTHKYKFEISNFTSDIFYDNDTLEIEFVLYYGHFQE